MIARSLAAVSLAVLLASPCLTAPRLVAQVTDFRPVTEETLREPCSWRLAQLEAHRQRVGVQPAR